MKSWQKKSLKEGLIYYARMKPKPVFYASNKLRNKMTQDHVLKEYNRVVLGTGNEGLD